VWWRFTPATNGTARLRTCTSSFDTVLAVYTGATVNTLTAIAANNRSPDCPLGNGSAVTIAVTAGTDYHIAVDGMGGLTGDVRLSIDLN
jgi:heme A synthase